MVLDLHTPCLNALPWFWQGRLNADCLTDHRQHCPHRLADGLDNMGVWTHTHSRSHTNVHCMTYKYRSCTCICAHIKMDRLLHVLLGLQAHLSLFCTLICFYWMDAHRISLSQICASSSLLFSDPATGQRKTSGSSHCACVCVQTESALDFAASLFVRALLCVGFSASLPG